MVHGYQWSKVICKEIPFKAVVLLFKLTLVIDVKLNIFDQLCPSLDEGLFQAKGDE